MHNVSRAVGSPDDDERTPREPDRGRLRPRRLLARLGLVLAGTLAGFGLVELALQLGGGAVRHAAARLDPVDFADGEVRVLCIGESTTASLWPEMLGVVLRDRRPDLEIHVYREAIVGARTDRIAIATDRWLDHYRPHVVLTMLGINDAGNVLVDPPRRPSVGVVAASRTVQLAKRLWRSSRHERRLEDLRLAELDIREGDVVEMSAERLAEFEQLCRLRTEYTQWFRYTELIGVLERIIRVDPRTPVYHLGAIEGVTMHRPSPEQLESFLSLRVGPDSDDEVDAALHDFTRRHPDEWSGFLMASAWHGHREDPDSELAVLATAARTSRFAGWAALRRASILLETGRDEEARVEIASAERRLPDDWVWSMVVGQALFKGGWPRDAADRFERALELRDRGPIGLDDIEYGRIASALMAAGEPDSATAWYARLDEIRTGHVRQFTRRNYRIVVAEATSRGIELVAVQYPTLDVLELQQLLDFRDDVTYCDNGRVFRDALRKADSYYDLFSDHFAGSFGHLTNAGDRLLATNVAECVLPLLPRQSSEVRAVATDQQLRNAQSPPARPSRTHPATTLTTAP